MDKFINGKFRLPNGNVVIIDVFCNEIQVSKQGKFSPLAENYFGTFSICFNKKRGSEFYMCDITHTPVYACDLRPVVKYELDTSYQLRSYDAEDDDDIIGRAIVLDENVELKEVFFRLIFDDEICKSMDIIVDMDKINDEIDIPYSSMYIDLKHIVK